MQYTCISFNGEVRTSSIGVVAALSWLFVFCVFGRATEHMGTVVNIAMFGAGKKNTDILAAVCCDAMQSRPLK